MSTDYADYTWGTDWLVLACLCDHDHVAVTVLESYDHDNTEPDEDEVILLGPDWRPLVVEVAAELHRQIPECRVSPGCTTTTSAGADRDRNWALTTAVVDVLEEAFPGE